MSALSDILLAKVGKTRSQLQQKRGIQGAVFRRSGVSDSGELKRICALPRRDWTKGIGGRNGTSEELVELLTEFYKTSHGTMRLWPQQAVGLAELHDFGGLVGPIPTSGGKTLLSFLAPSVVDAKRPLLIVPGALVDITRRKWHALSQHWLLHPIRVYSYSLLSREENKDFLHEYQPDLVIADESQNFKNLQAACTRRMHWFMNDHPGTIFVPLSGSPSGRSLHEISHLVNWALPKLSPIPKNYGVLTEWALCLDEKKTDLNTLAPGHLAKLMNDDELELMKEEPLRAARSAFRRRFIDTPGVVSIPDRQITIPLDIHAFDIDLDLPFIDEAFWTLRKKWCTPDGQPFAEAVKLWAHCRELVCGLYYVWDPPPPKGWLRARTAWYRFVRHTIHHNKRRIASEFQVALACERGEYNSLEYLEWVAVRGSFKPNSVPVWVHDKTLNHAATWMEANPRGIVWTEHRHFGRELARITGRPYHGAKGLDANGTLIEDANGPVIASVRSNSVGRDLQHKWDRNLVISCAPNGTVFEQMLARTHRSGQQAARVHVDLLLGCSEHYYGFRQALKDATYQEDTMGNPQKLLFANLKLPTSAEILTRGQREQRWAKGVKK